MELGVDIAELNVVNMRNVPPTPASYAQRSGRAGRSGQPALVFNYCAAGNSHDQYFFRRPTLMVSGKVRPPRLDLTNEDLVRAHVHAIWLAETGQSLGTSLADVLDLSGEEPSLALVDSLRQAISDPAVVARARPRCQRLLASIPGIEEAEWYSDTWLDGVLQGAALAFDRAADRWRDLYRAALATQAAQHKVILDASRPPQEKEQAKRLRAQAETQLALLRGETDGESRYESDFYSYRYFASEGFLPGYNFPRLPLSAFIPGRRGRDEFVQRPRFLAISEFGPRSIVYHEGSRYVINRVLLPVARVDGNRLPTIAVKRCSSCGYLHPLEGTDPGPDLCQRCGAPLDPPITGLLRLQNVATQRRERINSDEEERVRQGFEIWTGVRFARRDHLGERVAFVTKDGVEYAKLAYGSAATLWRVNVGWARRADRDRLGFLLDTERGYWAKSDQEAVEDVDDPLSPSRQRVVPYVEDRRNALLFQPLPRPWATGEIASLAAALKVGMQAVFQLEEAELAVEPLPSRDFRHLLLFYETAEGGAGALRRLVAEPDALGEVARAALEVCHFDPDSGQDRRHARGAKEDCEAACYDCLLSYHNQLDHGLLDRKLIRDRLLDLASASVAVSPAPRPREQHLESLLARCDTELERSFLRFLHEHGLELPTDAQYLIASCGARPDFILRGPPHGGLPGRAGARSPRRRRAGRPRRRAARGRGLPRHPRPPRGRLGGDRPPLSEHVRPPPEPHMTHGPGTLVKARGREWVVLPDSSDDLLLLRPLGGSDEEIAGILTALEEVSPATFDLPDPNDVGDARSARLLRDALRLTFRSSAGPFRSFGRLAVEPRPYQLVPLLMALKLDPVRLLIADDVGIGKTIEALLVARELLDQGEVQRLAVLCPPHLAEQWQAEMQEKFHLDAELVLSGTAARLERDLPFGVSLFERYPLTVVSTDYIKSDRRRDDFLRAAPELVIVDEAHTCADASAGRGGSHQRYQLVSGLARDPQRHLMLVTATPHSGKEDAFRALVGFLDPSFRELPDDLSTDQRARERRRLARHMVQRRRGDIEHFLADTPFPKRETREETYALTPEYRALFDKVLAYARETVADPTGGAHRQRVRWWAVLGLLRALASSPVAAAATLRTRASAVDATTPEEADELGRRDVLDLTDDESAEGMDVVPGADTEAGDDPELPSRRRLLALAREADALAGEADAKLAKGIALVRELVEDGYRPIVFCRFIPTAHYLADALRPKLAGVAVEAVTGELPPAERERRVLALAEAERRVLVATDCLSEGINLQEHFDAVVHYDLSWNPTRHEQREGRVDRFGQSRSPVRVLTYFGADNRIDGIVLDVLLRKHKAIPDSLGISVPVPVDSNAVLEAIMEGLILRGRDEQLSLLELPQLLSDRDAFHAEWDLAAERERRSRTVFAQETISTEEVARELEASRAAIGSSEVVERFLRDALSLHGATLSGRDPLEIDLAEIPRPLRDQLGLGDRTRLRARFQLPVSDGVVYLSRTSPLIEGLAGYVVDTALDPKLAGVAKRAGAMRTRTVSTRTTLLLVRIRYDIVTHRRGEDHAQIAEESLALAFEGAPESAGWLGEEKTAPLLDATPDGNVAPEQARELVARVIDGVSHLRPHLDQVARERAAELLDAHQRVRESARLKGVSYTVEPQLPVDLLGVYVLLPLPAP